MNDCPGSYGSGVAMSTYHGKRVVTGQCPACGRRVAYVTAHAMPLKDRVLGRHAAPASTSPRFTRTRDGRLTTTIDGVTYTATWYRSGGPGTRAYWTIRHDGPFAPDYDHDGNDWYEPNEQRVRESIVAYTANTKGGRS